MGVLHPAEEDIGTIFLLGAGRRCWPVFQLSLEYSDGKPDPLDRWSKRIISPLAQSLGGKGLFPSDGPPYAPFIRWALDTGRFHQSPTGMLIHNQAGLMISIRGAIALPNHEELEPQATESPCKDCDAPCVAACPVGALSASTAYDVPSCKDYLGSIQGEDCMSKGCRVRRICPVSQRFDRDPMQSAFHMAAFRG